MTLRNQIQELFCLTQGGELFRHTITPKSCGGTDDFKYLALIGDKILDLALIEIVSDFKTCDTGYLRIETAKIHNKRTLTNLGSTLRINNLMVPNDDNHKPTPDEIKESVEALIGASYKINGMKTVINIIKELLNFIHSDINDPASEEKSIYLDLNYIGLLQENLQKLGEEPPEYNYSDNLGLDHEPLYYCIVKLEIQCRTLQLRSGLFSTKKEARRQAAKQMLVSLGFMDHLSVKNEMNPRSDCPAKIVKPASKSMNDPVIIFEAHGIKNSYSKLEMNTNTGEKMLAYTSRKAKNPYSLLLLLSARLDFISGASWNTEIPGGYLVLLNLKIDESSFFEIGFGPSKTKARRIAAQKIIKSSGLMEVLEGQFKDMTI